MTSLSERLRAWLASIFAPRVLEELIAAQRNETSLHDELARWRERLHVIAEQRDAAEARYGKLLERYNAQFSGMLDINCTAHHSAIALAMALANWKAS